MSLSGCPVKIIRPPRSQKMLDHVTAAAKRKGMVVNGRKTKLMCVSAAASYGAKAELLDDTGEIIQSVDSIKVLGVHLDSDAKFTSHVAAIARKMRSKTWTLRDLKKTGLTEDQLIKVYISLIRPSAEYACAFWHSQITAEQAALIEAQQTRALRNIYGAGLSAARMRKKAGLTTLSQRRDELCLGFARKCVKSPRFSNWFQRKPYRAANERLNKDVKIFYENRAKTDKHFNSPISYMKRLLSRGYQSCCCDIFITFSFFERF